MPAFYCLSLFEPKCVLSNKAIELSAKLWSKMFNKVLIKLLSLNLARLILNLDTESFHVVSEGSGGKKVA